MTFFGKLLMGLKCSIEVSESVLNNVKSCHQQKRRIAVPNDETAMRLGTWFLMPEVAMIGED